MTAWTPALATQAPKVNVTTTSGRGMTPEEVAELCVGKIISISETAPPELTAQARAFRDRMLMVVTHYMRQAIASDRTTVYNALSKAGYPELAENIRGL